MEDLNQVSLGFTKGIKQLTSLELDEKYKVLSAKITQGRYGKTVLLELEQNVVFLPKKRWKHVCMLIGRRKDNAWTLRQVLNVAIYLLLIKDSTKTIYALRRMLLILH
ncbi:hypothetical protein QE152_g10938, partial [Popillia japonica]